MSKPSGPLLVYGAGSTTYDFGPAHPLTPRRFGPGVDLLRAVGAEPGLAPEPAPDEELHWVHEAGYVETVRRLSADPSGPSGAGIGPGDDPAFAGMHDAAAAVAGGSLRAMEAILRGDVEHAFHPGGGLHHAMPDRASGFCIYNDPALAIALARRVGLRVLYVDLDVHHGDGVQAIHASDPGVLTISFHESGRYLFPGTGFVDEVGEGTAAGTIANVPLEPFTGEDAWWTAVSSIVPSVAAAFGPDLLVTQHGADSHAWDPLAHLRVTTSAMGRGARLLDEVAHRFAGGRWLATGGGGYDVYRVVPRAWALTWLAGAHREPPARIPTEWRERWGAEAGRYGQAPIPEHFEDDPNAGLPTDLRQPSAEAQSIATARLVHEVHVPALLKAAEERGWWEPLAAQPDAGEGQDYAGAKASPTVLGHISAEALERLTLAKRVIAPMDESVGRRILLEAAKGGAAVSVAASGGTIVGAVVTARSPDAALQEHELLALGVAPAVRGKGLGKALLVAHLAELEGPVGATVTLAERDPVEPDALETRRRIARSLLLGAGFELTAPAPPIATADPGAVSARRDGETGRADEAGRARGPK
jgi:acetoin utilization protein AcuC